MIRTFLAIIEQVLRAAAAALSAAPIIAAWTITNKIDDLNEEIIKHEALNTPAGKRAARELRIKRDVHLGLYDALLAAVPALPKRSGNSDGEGRVQGPG